MTKIYELDILQKEKDEDLPYWLDPSQRYDPNSERSKAIREKYRSAWLAKQEAKKEKAFDESQHPRGQPENAGQFGPGGGGGGESTSAQKPAAEEKPAKQPDPEAFGFNKQQTDALTDYAKTDGSVEVNKFMRADGKGKYSAKKTKELQDQVAAIKGALAKSELPQQTTLYRAIAPCKVATELGKDHTAEKLVGTALPLGGFQSTSASWDDVQHFARAAAASIFMVLDVPAKTNAIDMKPFSKYDEAEFLLDQGKFVVTSVNRDPDTNTLTLFGKYAKSA